MSSLMGMKVGPRQKHLFYMEMAKLLGAGFNIRRAAEVMGNTKLPPAQILLLKDLDEGLESGESITDAFSRDSRAISRLERSMIAAGERGGKLAPAFQHLSDYFGMLASARIEIVKGMIYPLIVLHLGIFVGSVPLSMMGEKQSAGEIAGDFAISLIVLYVSAAAVFFLGRFMVNRSSGNPAFDRALNRIPWIGPARRSMAMSRFCKVYHACLLAGISMVETVQVSAESAQGGMIGRAGKRIAAVAAGGNPLGPQFIAENAFPSEFSRSYATGEEAGTLDIDMGNWSRKFQEAAETSMKTASIMVPKVLYFLIMGYVAWRIVGFFTGYYSELDSL
ncbi:MAG: type II secretion system F family protein [Akkermansiaceae bacterium]